MVQNPSGINSVDVAKCVVRFRDASPHIHCITNSVAQNFTANVLLAAGATPSMTIAVAEIADFVSMADALLINLGTMDAERTMAIERAVSVARTEGKPWALDPVYVQTSPGRLTLAGTLVAKMPNLVRCNAGEFRALFGTDSGDIGTVAASHDTTIALTGRQDVICANSAQVLISNGSTTMDRITAMGCALTALAIGFFSVEKNHLLAATSALAFFALAGEHAERLSSGPGTFLPHFLDALSNLSASDIEAEVKLT